MCFSTMLTEMPQACGNLPMVEAVQLVEHEGLRQAAGSSLSASAMIWSR